MRRRPAWVRLKTSSNVSLHQRFSQVQAEQAMQPQMASAPASVLLLVASSSAVNPQVAPACFSLVPAAPPPPVRASVWTRLGSRRVGFWTFRSKYGWRARCRAALAKASRRAERRSVATGRFRKFARGWASGVSLRGRSPNTPTKKELDAQLENYMSKSKKRLDAQLDDYMARSKKRLDADLDEYMALAGQPLPWIQ